MTVKSKAVQQWPANAESPLGRIMCDGALIHAPTVCIVQVLLARVILAFSSTYKVHRDHVMHSARPGFSTHSFSSTCVRVAPTLTARCPTSGPSMHVAPQEVAAGAGRGREPSNAATDDGRGVVEGQGGFEE